MRMTTEKKPLVLCFHHAGGSIVTFRAWAKNQEVEFVPIEYPHRNVKDNKILSQNSEKLLDALVKKVLPLIENREFYIFGHSMGALIGFELCIKLEQEYHTRANALYVVGKEPPIMEDPSPYRCAMGIDALMTELKRVGGTPDEVFANKEIMDYFMPIMYNDYQVLESFIYHGEKTNIPIIAHTGESDTDANPDIMKYWEEVTTAEFTIKRFKGSHFFLYDNGDSYLNYLITDIKNRKINV